MHVSMYKASVATFDKHLHALDGLLDKAAAYADAKKHRSQACCSPRGSIPTCSI